LTVGEAEALQRRDGRRRWVAVVLTVLGLLLYWGVRLFGWDPWLGDFGVSAVLFSSIISMRVTWRNGWWCGYLEATAQVVSCILKSRGNSRPGGSA